VLVIRSPTLLEPDPSDMHERLAAAAVDVYGQLSRHLRRAPLQRAARLLYRSRMHALIDETPNVWTHVVTAVAQSTLRSVSCAAKE
jgi:hypothetical protein